jgi:hypothetical protein
LRWLWRLGGGGWGFIRLSRRGGLKSGLKGRFLNGRLGGGRLGLRLKGGRFENLGLGWLERRGSGLWDELLR